MIKKNTTVAGRVLAVLMVFALLLAANCCVLSASADTLGTTIYLKTTKTTTPYIHYWNNAKQIGSSWPGVAMTSEGDVYSYELPCDVGELEGVIFLKDGGGDGSKLTNDVTNITGNLYDLDAGKWSMYDTSSIKIKSAGADIVSPQYIGSKITLSVDAEGGDGNLQYKISANGTALSDYSANKSVVWEPKAEGDYKILFEVKDGSGETNSREMSFTVKSADNAEEPIFLGAVPANGASIKPNSAVTVDVNGAGGHVNNNILFYKTEVVDPYGAVVNTAYYQTGSKITFTPSLIGEYTVNMYIQNNTVNNTTTKATYTYVSTNDVFPGPVSDSDIIEPVTDSDTNTDIVEPVTDSDTNSDIVEPVTDSDTNSDVVEPVSDTDTSTDLPDSTRGDFDNDGKVELEDAYSIQIGVLAKKTFTAEEIARADVNGDGKITLKDASLIQQYKASVNLDVISKYFK